MTRLNVHRMGTTVSLWKGTGARIEIEAEDVATILRELNIGNAATTRAEEWAAAVRKAVS